MPVDFIPRLTDFRVTKDDPSPIEDRIQHIQSLDRRTGPAFGAPISGISREVLLKKLQSLRVGIKLWGRSQIQGMMVAELNAKYPDLKHNRNPIASLTELLDWIKSGVWDNGKREVVHFVSEDIWGDNNQPLVNLEKQFCNLFGIAFTGLKSNGQPMQRNHSGNCTCAIFVKEKGTVVTRIRNACKRRWHECVYRRKDGSDTEDDDEGTTSEKASRSLKRKTAEDDFADEGSKKRKKTRQRVPKRVLQEVCSKASHGFDGKIGYFEGHPELPAKMRKKAPTAAVILKNQTGLLSPVTCATAASVSSTSMNSDRSPRTKFDKDLESLITGFDLNEIREVMMELKKRKLEESSNATKVRLCDWCTPLQALPILLLSALRTGH